MTVGIGLLLLKADTSKEFLLNDGILLAVCIGISSVQLGTVPLTFEAVGGKMLLVGALMTVVCGLIGDGGSSPS